MSDWIVVPWAPAQKGILGFRVVRDSARDVCAAHYSYVRGRGHDRQARLAEARQCARLLNESETV